MRSGRLPVLTLVAVFVSLGLGLLMGAAISGSDEIWLRQQAVLANLEAEVGRVRSVQDQLSLRLHEETAARQTAENISETLLEWAVADRLQGEQVALLYASPGADGASRALRRLLQLAGSQIVFQHHLGELGGSMPRVDQLVADMCTAAAVGREGAGQPPMVPDDSDDLPHDGPPSSGPAPPSASATVEQDVCDSLILLVLVKAGERPDAPSPPSDTEEPPDASARTFLDFHRDLLQQAREQGIRRIALGIFRDGAEVAESLVQTYSRQQALVVDGVDTSGGQAALVLGLSVDARGVLGVFPDAVLIPAYPRVIPAGAEADASWSAW